MSTSWFWESDEIETKKSIEGNKQIYLADFQFLSPSDEEELSPGSGAVYYTLGLDETQQLGET